jgi:hypothetical protein
MDQCVSMETSRTKSTPLRKGPLYGLRYCGAGVGLGACAHAVGGLTRCAPLAARSVGLRSRPVDGSIHRILVAGGPMGRANSG